MHARLWYGALVLALAACSGSSPNTPIGCPAPAVDCGGACVDLATNAAHCGSCNKTCAATETCSSGLCVCETPNALCGQTCASLADDAANCGACGRVCPTGDLCFSGTCGPATCPLTAPNRCGSACVDLQSDDLNCASCGVPCNAPLHCVSGSCTNGCPPFKATCGSSCAYLAIDDASCGACGVSCSAGTVCSDGACAHTCAGQARFPGMTSVLGFSYSSPAALGDLDGDGHPDLVLVWPYGGIDVARGLPGGWFQTPVRYAVSSPVRVALADFNGDGKLDAAVAESAYGTHAVAVMLNAGDGTLQAPNTYVTNAYPTEISAADLDGDGDVDVAVLTGSTVEILANAGNGTFGAPVSYALGGSVSNPDQIEIGDVTGDGKPDVVVSHSSGIAVFPNQGGGAFAASPTLYSFGNDTPMHMKLADMDGDGRIDVVFTTWRSSGIASVRWNAASNPFSTKTDVVLLGLQLTWISASDVDADGDLDLVVADWDRKAVAVIENLGGRAFASAVEVAAHDSPTFASVAPLDGNASVDLLIISDGVVEVLPGAGGGVFEGPARLWPPVLQQTWPYNPEDVHLLELADLNRDGTQDLVVATYNRFNVDVAFGNGDGTFGPWTAYPASYYIFGIAVADMNGDGWPDIVYLDEVSSSTGANEGIRVLRNEGNGTFTPLPLVLCPDAQTFAVGDVNEDGNLDVVAATPGSFAEIEILLGNGDGSLQPAVNVTSTSYHPVALAVADMNGDGMGDIIYEGFSTSSKDVLVFQNKGGATLWQRFQYSQPVKFPTVGYPVGLAISDVNGDGRPDIAVLDDGFRVYLNAGTWFTHIDYTFTGRKLRMQDLNGDRRPDAILARDSGIAVSLQGADGTFGVPVLYPAGPAQDIALGDLDGDGQIDALTSNAYGTSASGDDISILRGLCR